jgi:hypothetical protein
MSQRIAGALALSLFCTGCNPYLYGPEINGFSTGVNALGSAYRSALDTTESERNERQWLRWVDARADLALSEGCGVSAPGQPIRDDRCQVKQVGGVPPSPSETEAAAAQAAPIVQALRQYVAALSAVTNAADRQALEAATGQFRDALQGLATQLDPNTGARLGPVAEIFGAGVAMGLDMRRFSVLRHGVNRARDDVTTLGTALGTTLDSLRTARVNELAATLNDLMRSTSSLSRAEYAARAGVIASKVEALESLRLADPNQGRREDDRGARRARARLE